MPFPVGTDTPKNYPKRPGPAPMDIALLTRHRLWAWIVLMCTPEADSWHALDEHWLEKIDGGTSTQRPLRKVFQRYFHIGNDPGKLRGINGVKLVKAVHAAPPPKCSGGALHLPVLATHRARSSTREPG